MNVDAVVERGFGYEGLAAARRSVEQHAVWGRDAVFFRALSIFYYEDNALGEVGLQFFHSGDVAESVAVALLDFDVNLVGAVLTAALSPLSGFCSSLVSAAAHFSSREKFGILKNNP